MKVLSTLRVPLINLVLATLLGGLLRFLFIHSIGGLNYKFILHAHSHIAFLGWAYMSFFILLIQVYFSENQLLCKKYNLQFWVTQVTVIGMLISFPIQGYGLYSILFSSLHILLSYWFTYSFFKDLRNDVSLRIKHVTSLKFIKASFLFLILSSIGPWSLGIIMAKGLSAHPIYNLCIYFYLHFLYNGWFTFVVLGLCFAFIEQRRLLLDNMAADKFFWVLFISCIAGYSLSALWLNPPFIVYVIGFVAATLQLISLVYFFAIVKKSQLLNGLNPLPKNLFLIAVSCFVLKLILQWFSSFMPVFELRNLIIGYLHLTVLGFITIFIISFAIMKGLIIENSYLRFSIILVIIGFVGSELMIFGQGLFALLRFGSIPFYDKILFGFSILMPIGFIISLMTQMLQSKRIIN